MTNSIRNIEALTTFSPEVRGAKQCDKARFCDDYVAGCEKCSVPNNMDCKIYRAYQDGK